MAAGRGSSLPHIDENQPVNHDWALVQTAGQRGVTRRQVRRQLHKQVAAALGRQTAAAGTAACSEMDPELAALVAEEAALEQRLAELDTLLQHELDPSDAHLPQLYKQFYQLSRQLKEVQQAMRAQQAAQAAEAQLAAAAQRDWRARREARRRRVTEHMRGGSNDGSSSTSSDGSGSSADTADLQRSLSADLAQALDRQLTLSAGGPQDEAAAGGTVGGGQQVEAPAGGMGGGSQEAEAPAGSTAAGLGSAHATPRGVGEPAALAGQERPVDGNFDTDTAFRG